MSTGKIIGSMSEPKETKDINQDIVSMLTKTEPQAQPQPLIVAPQQAQQAQQAQEPSNPLLTDPLMNLTLHKGQLVALIHNKETVCPATIINLRGRQNGIQVADLEALIPTSEFEYDHVKQARVPGWKLIKAQFLQCQITNPLNVYERMSLEIPQHLRTNAQVLTDRWIFNGKRLRQPRFDGFAISHVGKFFVPDYWYYLVNCYRFEKEMGYVNPVKTPAERKYYPKDYNYDQTTLFTSFESAFKAYWKQKYTQKGMQKWGSVTLEGYNTPALTEMLAPKL